MYRILIKALLISILIVLAYRFTPRIDQSAYQDAITLKKESIQLMSMGAESFIHHQKEIKELISKLDHVYQFQEGRKNVNVKVLNLYSGLINDPELLPGFFRKWEEESSLSEGFIDNKIRRVENTFDEIIELENRRLKQTISAYY